MSSFAPAVEVVWMGDDQVVPGIGHRSDPVLGADLVFSIIDGRCVARLQGPVTRRSTYAHRQGAEYIGLRFRPGAAAATVGAALAELRDGATEVDHFGRIGFDEFGDRLVAAETLNERGLLVAGHLAGEGAAWLEPDPLVLAALDGFERGFARSARVGCVAEFLGVSERRLQRRFAQHLGMTPKHAARIVRVRRLDAHLRSAVHVDLAVAAVAAGFYDQSHMTNEVSRLLDTTPRALVEELTQSSAGSESR